MFLISPQTYRDFHSDLYPETTGYKTELMASEWFGGANMPVPKMSLDPAKRELGDLPIIVSKYSALTVIYVILQQLHTYIHNSIFHYAFNSSLCPPFVLIFYVLFPISISIYKHLN